MRLLATAFCSMVIANVYAQDSYNIEAGGQYMTSSADDSTDQKITGIGGTYYLKPIKIDSTKPYAELDFLQRASGISVLYGVNKFEDADFLSTNIPQLKVGGVFYVDNFVLGASTQSFDKNFNLKQAPASYYGIKNEATTLSVGYFVLPNTLVSFVNEKETQKHSPSTGLAAIKDLTNTTNSVTSHSVISLGGTESLVLDFSYKQVNRDQTTSKDNTIYEAKARYYPKNNIFVEGGYSKNTGDTAYFKGKTTLLGLGYSFTPRFALSITALDFSGDVASEKSSSKTTGVIASYRF